METGIAVIGIAVEDKDSAESVNELLHQYSQYIIGRMGPLCAKKRVNIINVMVNMSRDIINTLSGELGRLQGTSSKVLYSNVDSQQNYIDHLTGECHRRPKWPRILTRQEEERKNMNYDPKSSHTERFVHHGETEEILVYGEANRIDREPIDEILAEARERRDLTHKEAMVLLDCGPEDKNQEIYELAEQIKKDFYGNRTVLSAPLYLSNYCTNGCVYCPYHAKNKHIPRRKLTQDGIRREVMVLQDMGHKCLTLETGRDSVHNPIERMLESIDTIYSIKHENGVICRVNVNIVVTIVGNYRKPKDVGINTYTPFQEIYYKESYEKLHSTGPKYDYCYHTEAVDRAQLDDIDDVGCGVLSGLEFYRYEFAGFLMHAEHLEAMFGVGPHTISAPRIRRTSNIDPDSFGNGIDDDTFAELVACIRVAIPYIGMIVSTGKNQKTRERVLYLGIPQVSGGSKTNVGGYFEPEPKEGCSAQFNASNNRILDQVMNWFMGMGHTLSFCTARYRKGHTDGRFISLCKSGQIRNCCHPNALIMLKEYLMDYGSGETKCIGGALVEKEIGSIPREKVQQIVRDNLAKIEQGIRDFRF